MTDNNQEPIAVNGAHVSVDALWAATQARLDAMNEERAELVADRAQISTRIKELNVEIDKAERMTKALIPRHRSSKAVG